MSEPVSCQMAASPSGRQPSSIIGPAFTSNVTTNQPTSFQWDVYLYTPYLGLALNCMHSAKKALSVERATVTATIRATVYPASFVKIWRSRPRPPCFMCRHIIPPLIRGEITSWEVDSRSKSVSLPLVLARYLSVAEQSVRPLPSLLLFSPTVRYLSPGTSLLPFCRACLLPGASPSASLNQRSLSFPAFVCALTQPYSSSYCPPFGMSGI